MSTVLIEVGQVVVGVSFGVLALAYLIVTIRSFASGQGAYEANRSASHPSVLKTVMGDMPSENPVKDRRSNHGLAINLKTGALKGQQRLSSEAVDDVIGRRF